MINIQVNGLIVIHRQNRNTSVLFTCNPRVRIIIIAKLESSKHFLKSIYEKRKIFKRFKRAMI